MVGSREFLALAFWAVTLSALGVWYFQPGARRRLLPPQRSRAVPWSGFDTLLAALAFYAVPWLVGLAAKEVLTACGFFAWEYGPGYRSRPDDELSAVRAGLWVSPLVLPFALATVPCLLRLLCDARPYQLGLTASRFGKNTLVGLLAWVFFVGAIYLVLFLAAEFNDRVLHAPSQDHVFVQLVRQQPLPEHYALIVFAAVVVAPLLEELLFRGLLQRWFASRPGGGDAAVALALVASLWGHAGALKAAFGRFDLGRPASLGDEAALAELLRQLVPALFVVAMVGPYLLVRWKLGRKAPAGIFGTALLFASMHTAWPQPVALFALALVLGYLAYRTQSLVPSITLHALFNGVACVGLLLS